MILTSLQKEFLKIFFNSYLGQLFFLTGGTALAQFYLHHRLSEDLDLFTIDQNITFDRVNAEANKIARRLSLHIEHQVTSPTFIEYIFRRKEETLKVDLVKDVPIHFGKMKKVEGIVVDSLENISVGKLLALFGRADAKDYIDLYFLLKIKGVNFNTVFENARKKDLGLDKFYFAHMVSRVREISLFPKTLKPYSRKDLVEFFVDLSNKLLQEVRPKG